MRKEKSDQGKLDESKKSAKKTRSRFLDEQADSKRDDKVEEVDKVEQVQPEPEVKQALVAPSKPKPKPKQKEKPIIPFAGR